MKPGSCLWDVHCVCARLVAQLYLTLLLPPTQVACHIKGCPLVPWPLTLRQRTFSQSNLTT